MNRLIDDLLSLSRIELTEHQTPSERVDIGGVVESVAEAFEPRVRERGVTIATEVSAGLPRIVADHDQMMQVLQNLVDNAVKYGKEGGCVRIVAALAPPGGRWPARPGIMLAVSDDGPGIRARMCRVLPNGFTGSTKAGPGREAAPGSASPSSSTSSTGIAASSSSRAMWARARRSPCGCRWRNRGAGGRMAGEAVVKLARRTYCPRRCKIAGICT